MNAKRMRRVSLAAVLAISALLAACGGGGGDGNTNLGKSPDDNSPAGAFITYVQGLVNGLLDTAEPADVTAFDPPPVADTAEPKSTL
jgi:hypothetical protein